MTASDYRQKAREALKGFWVISIIIAVIASLLGGTDWDSSSSSNSNRGDRDFRSVSEYQDMLHGRTNPDSRYYDWRFDAGLPAKVGSEIKALIGTGVLIIVVIQLIIGGFIELGYKLYNIKLIKAEEPRGFETLFALKEYFGSAFVLRLLRGVCTFLWALLFIIPGIVAAYSYAMSSYIMAEDPEIGPSIALQLSKEMMNGHKFELFCLHLSFIGWEILGQLFFGIGMAAVLPYKNAAEAAFYLNITGQMEM